jgi:hypothetical protein
VHRDGVLTTLARSRLRGDLPETRFLDSFLFADYLEATRKASSPSSIHVELEIENLDSSELNFLS